MNIDSFFALDRDKRFCTLTVAALGANRVIAGIEVADNEFCTVGLVGLFAIDKDNAARRIRRNLDMTQFRSYSCFH